MKYECTKTSLQPYRLTIYRDVPTTFDERVPNNNLLPDLYSTLPPPKKITNNRAETVTAYKLNFASSLAGNRFFSSYPVNRYDSISIKLIEALLIAFCSPIVFPLIATPCEDILF